MPEFLIPIISWLADRLLTLLARYIDDAIVKHQQVAELTERDSAQNQAALAKLQAAKTSQDRINAAKDALQGL